MKTFKVIICALFVLCCGAFLTACGEKDFNENKIVVGESQFVYDGESHIVDVGYKGVKTKVTYALEGKKKEFKPLNKFKFVNAGTYKLYYRLSADGYNTYTSKGYLELKILPRRLEVLIFDYNLKKSDVTTDYFIGHTHNGAVEGDELGLAFNFGEDFDKENLEYGQTYEIGCTIENDNYALDIERPGVLTVTDYVQIENADSSISYFANLQDAIDAAQSGDTIKLNDHIYINEGIEVDKSVTIDGQYYSINANQLFTSTEHQTQTLTSLINVFNADVELTLKDVVVNGNQVARCVSMFDGSLTLDSATITSGRKVDAWLSGGVYVGSEASFVMNSGSIGNNDSNDYEYTRYCSDLYIATEDASILGGRVDNVFVAANLTLNGGEIYNVYVEYKDSTGATFEYTTGTITNLMVSTTTTGEYEEVQAVAGTTYEGGTDYTVTE